MTPATPDFLLPTRAAMMAALKANAGVTALVPKAQVYAATVPADRPWPFMRFASMIASPFLASGLDSSAFRITLQAFSKGQFSGKTLILPAEDHVINIGSAIKTCLHGATLTLSTGDKLRLQWVQSLPMIDGDEAGAWMNSIIFTGDVAG
jgi:hypothetical protein